MRVVSHCIGMFSVSVSHRQSFIHTIRHYDEGWLRADCLAEDCNAIDDIFVNQGQSQSGDAKAIVTVRQRKPAIALYNAAYLWYKMVDNPSGVRSRFYHSVKWWQENTNR